MSEQCGAAFVVSFKDSGGTYRVVSGLRTKSIAINSELVDITNSDSAGRWRHGLDGCGVRSASISGEGVFEDGLGQNAVFDAMMNNQIRDAKILVPGLGTFEGKFKVTQIEASGEHNAEATYSQTFESAGELVFTGV
jgi:TP901-1 family phage major tail protein